MRMLCAIGGLAAAALVFGWVGQVEVRSAVQPGNGAGHPVVVAELFTSEGCSSCPPADDLLRRLSEGDLASEVQVIALGEHVDYWDRLGWRDASSSSAFSARQSAYDAAVFRTGGIYTPQLVVDGVLQAVGSDASAVRRVVAEAARHPKATVLVTATRPEPDRMRVDVRAEVGAAVSAKGSADLVVAVTEDGVVSHVRRGENGGRTLRHAAVVRSLTTIGALPKGERSISANALIPLSRDWPPQHLQIVAFLQERASRRILGAGATAVAGAQQPASTAATGVLSSRF